MKSVRSALIVATLLLVSCASSGSHHSEASWWNPLDWSWSTLWPGNWFGASLTVTEQGVGAVNGETPLQESAISEALNGDYRLRQGMRSEQGSIVSFWQALKDDEVRLILSGKESVSRIEISDPDIASADGTRIGDAFSKRYQKAFGHCQPVVNEASVLCQAPDSQHISYLYQGKWAGPQGLIPPDDVLQSWRVSKIIWQR
ncbi:RpoE-regulated lipoprotein [Mixta intestinalis]|jgi:hypothetical protein|uniref:RpoE-regulated lipoprotein n=1 Tax=Mixta intestinalis TaxID=1615494 RepID=A0A6P1Q295_9GAMM|nr:RpoE-regulated lipoprotein [Mixta intestinalis]QHM71975.1 hypothetical protein C7M51_02274 [Mixta intestinalis]